MTKDEFCQRFKYRMLERSKRVCPDGNFTDGGSIAEYADEVAPTYWEQPDQCEEGPEACADADMSYWERV